ncbi:phage major capsid protein [Acidaminobacterium chupaoyuni]
MSYNNFVPTVFSQQMLESMKNDNVAVRLSDARYRSDAKYGEEIKINGVGKVAIRDYVKGQPLVRDGWEDQSTMIRIDQQKYFNFGIDDIDKRQAQGDLMKALREEANMSLAEAADTFIYSLYGDAGVKLEEGALNSGNVLSTISSAMKALYKNKVPKNARFSLEVSPDFLEKMLLADVIYGKPNEDTLKNGFVGRVGKWLNVDVYMTNNLCREQNKDCILLRTKRAIAYVENMSEVEAYRPEDSFEDALKGLHVYGAKVVRPDELAVIKCAYAPETNI